MPADAKYASCAVTTIGDCIGKQCTIPTISGSVFRYRAIAVSTHSSLYKCFIVIYKVYVSLWCRKQVILLYASTGCFQHGKISPSSCLTPSASPWLEGKRRHCSLEAKPLVVGQIWRHVSERALKEISNALVRSTVALVVSESCAYLSKQNVEIGQIWPWMTSSALTFDLT